MWIRRLGVGIDLVRIAHSLRGARCGDTSQPMAFIRQWQQRVSLGAADSSARMFAQEEHDKREDQAQADRERKRYDGHGKIRSGDR